jgi:hypothetical protein
MSAGPNKHALDMALQAKEGGSSPDMAPREDLKVGVRALRALP